MFCNKYVSNDGFAFCVMISLNSTNWKVWIARIITLFVPLFFCACSDSFIDNQTTINVAQNISQQATTENELYYLRHQIDTINSYYRFYAEEFSEESMAFVYIDNVYQ